MRTSRALRISVLPLLCAASACAFAEPGCSPRPAPPVEQCAIGVRPPPPSSTEVTGAGAGSTVFAIRRLSLGDIDLENPDAGYNRDRFKYIGKYGYDIDGILRVPGLCRSTACKQSNASTNPDGIDNNFADDIVVADVQGLAGEVDYSLLANAAIDAGRTMLFQVDGLGEQPNQGPLSAAVYRGERASPPSWDGADVWLIDPASLSSGQPTPSFIDSYVASDT